MKEGVTTLYNYFSHLGLLFLIALLSLFALRAICIHIADKKILNKKEDLYRNNYYLASKCTELGDIILAQKNDYFSNIYSLGLARKIDCSSSILAKAEKNSTKYIVKYSDIENNAEGIEKIDFCIKYSENLKKFYSCMKELTREVHSQLPLFEKVFATFDDISYMVCDIAPGDYDIEEPIFSFSYESPAGNIERIFRVYIDLRVLKEIKIMVQTKNDKSEYIKMQRNAMTNDLREAIKLRDKYTCCICGNSVYNEPNLLLEVDHIIPVSKGGKTEVSNLQTLCWKCNRQKGNTILSE